MICAPCSIPDALFAQNVLTKHTCTARRREALAAAGKLACRANAAVAREPACRVWEIGRQPREPSADGPPAQPPPAGRARASTHRRRAFTTFLWAAREPRSGKDWFRTSASDGESKCGGAHPKTDCPPCVPVSPRILACQASVG